MNPENLTSEALALFNSLGLEARHEAVRLAGALPETEAVYLAAMRRMDDKERRELLFSLSRKKWEL